MSVNKENGAFLGPKKRTEPIRVSPLKDEDVHDAEEITCGVNVPHMRTNEKLIRCKFAEQNSKFSTRVNSTNPFTITRELVKEINIIAGNILELWNKYLENLSNDNNLPKNELYNEYCKNMKETLGYFTFSKCPEINHEKYIENFKSSGYCKINPKISVYFLLSNFNKKIQDQTIFSDTDRIPLIFEDFIPGCDNMPLTTNNNQYAENHLYILVHGFQACANDMRLLKNQLNIFNPKSHILCSTANEKGTDGDIREMGKRLSDEVKKYIKKWFPNPENLHKITFFAHSLGGLIARSALPWLDEYKEKMWSFVTFSSPHLGYMFSESKIINAGLWVLKKWLGSQCLEQLSFTDKPNLSECFLYRLAMNDVLFL